MHFSNFKLQEVLNMISGGQLSIIRILYDLTNNIGTRFLSTNKASQKGGPVVLIG